MGAENSVMKPPTTKRETDRRSTVQRIVPSSSQYHDVKNTKYIESESQSQSQTASSSESTTTSEDGDEKKEPKLFEKCQNESKQGSISTPLKSLEGLAPSDKVKKSEEMLRRLWKRPHPSWDVITAVTSVTTEKTNIDGQVSDEVNREVDYHIDKTIYDVPLDYCHLKVPHARTARSCPDPWRRHGAHVKLCEIGGYMLETRKKDSEIIHVRKGSTPPPPPKKQPLQSTDDYLKLLRK